jgi:hypothetical protein
MFHVIELAVQLSLSDSINENRNWPTYVQVSLRSSSIVPTCTWCPVVRVRVTQFTIQEGVAEFSVASVFESRVAARLDAYASATELMQYSVC